MSVIRHRQAKITQATDPKNSALVDCDTLLPCGVFIPGAWDAANITFQGTWDGGTTWNNVYDKAGSAITVTSPAVNSYYAIDYTAFVGLKQIRIVSSANQTADRTVTIACREI